MYKARPGDILLYRKHPWYDIPQDAIDLGERLEDGPQPVEYFHVAIALGEHSKIEANSGPVSINTIDYGNFDAFRPPIPKNRIYIGLHATRKDIGQRYDWALIVDDALHFLTHGIVHLPRSYIRNEERREKICSTLAAVYFGAAKWGKLKRWPRPTPEDVWLLVKDYPAEKR